MKHYKRIITILLLTTLFINFTPLTRAIAEPLEVPSCLLYVFLPIAIHGNQANDQAGQQEMEVRTNYPSEQPDFNGDGCADLAIGVSQETLDSGGNQGLVQVMYGSSIGVTAEHSQVWHREGGYDSGGNFLGDIQGDFRANDHFGETLTTGDFNNDGYTDLAVGIQYSIASAHPNAGAVNILYGTSVGLPWVGNQFLSQNEVRDENDGSGAYTYLGDLVADAEAYDYFGHALAAGNFDGDAYDGLAIGAWGEGIGSLGDAGAFHIVRGSAGGLTAFNNEHWHQKAAYRDTNADGDVDITIGNPDGTEESNDWLGYSLAASNFDGDPYDDLAVGVPNEGLWIDGVEYTNTGVTQVFYGSNDGLSLANEQFWQQEGEYSIGDMYGSNSEDYDKFGTTLTTGDINGDGFSELVVGVPNESFAEIGGNVGSVNVIYGSNNGLDLPNHQWLYQDLAIGDDGSVLGSLVSDASFNTYLGQAITTVDFNNDGYEELVIGVPGYKLEGTNDEVGANNIVKGTRDGLVIPGNQLWHQDGGWDNQGSFLGDPFDTAEDNDAFGGGLP